MRFQRFLSGVLSAALAVAFIPQTAMAQDEDCLAQREAAELEETLAQGDYAEGQAIVVVDTSVGDSLSGAVHSLLAGEDLLAGAETVMDASGNQFAEVAGQSQATDVQVKCVTSTTLSTQELIERLLQDPRVLSAEPNMLAGASALEENDAAQSASVQTASSGVRASGTAASAASSIVGIEPLAAKKATNITGTAAMPDLSSYQWYAGADEGTMAQPGITKTSSLNVPGWNEADTASGTVVAVMDSGVNYNHPDLQPAMMDMTSYNQGTIYEGVAGKYGYNASGTNAEETSDPKDDLGHGTHVAGIIAANRDGKGTTGIAAGVKIVAVRILDEEGELSFLSALKGYEYLSAMMDKGLALASVNCSWSGKLTSPGLCLAMTKLGQKGAVTCVASGNDSEDISNISNTTSNFATSPYVVVVNSVNALGEKSDFSNWGQQTTDLFAPGSSILSSYGTSYLSYADPNPAYYQDFSEASSVSGITVHKVSGDAAPFAEGKNVASYSEDATFDSGTGCLSIPLDQTSISPTFDVMIPVSKEVIESSSHLGFSVCSKFKNVNVSVSIAVTTKNGKCVFPYTSSNVFANTWIDGDLSLSKQVKNSDYGTGIAYKDGCICLRLQLSSSNVWAFAKKSGVLYLDCVGLGSNVCDYRVELGTSMATPCVTASAAVISSQLRSQGVAGERLGQQVAWVLKGSVVQSDSLRSLCTSGGSLNFDMLGVQTPVIDESSQGDGTLTLEGIGFGDGPGKVTLGEKAAGIVSWSNQKVVVSVPSGLESGLYTATVANASGRTGSAGVSVSAGAPTLYEKTVRLPRGIRGPAGASFTCAAAIGKKIYVLCSNDYGDSVAYRQLWCYKTSTGSWTRYAILPYKQAERVSMVAYKGKLLVSCCAPLAWGGKLTKSNGLYTFTPSTNKWKRLKGIKLPYATTLANFGGKLLCVGGTGSKKLFNSYTSTSIYKIGLKKKALKRVGRVFSSTTTLQASSYGDTLYVSRGMFQDADESMAAFKPSVCAYRWSKGRLVRYKMLKALPKAASGYMRTYGAAATPAGLVISGYPAKGEDGTKSAYDTYVLKVSKRGVASCKRLSKSFAYGVALQLTSVYCKGWLYTIGATYSENAPVTMRATKL